MSIVFATLLALSGAIGRLSRNPFINGIASLYVSLVRGTPLIVQIYFIYLALPQLGHRPARHPVGDHRPELQLRRVHDRGLPRRHPGRAARASARRPSRWACTERLVMWRIVMPQAFRIVIPAIGNDFVAMLKDSSLVSILAVEELLFRSQLVGRQNFRSLEALVIAAADLLGPDHRVQLLPAATRAAHGAG